MSDYVLEVPEFAPGWRTVRGEDLNALTALAMTGASYDSAEQLAQVKPYGNYLWVGGYMYQRLIPPAVSDESALRAGDESVWVYAEPEVYGEAFGVLPYDGSTDSSDALMLATRIAIAQGKIMRLRLPDTGISKPWLHEGAPVKILLGGTTAVKTNPGFGAGRPIQLSGLAVVGPLSVVWNDGNGQSTTTYHPVFALGADAQRDQWLLTPSLPMGYTLEQLLSPGDLVSIQSQHLAPGEHRYYMVEGELSRVKRLTDDGKVELETPLKNPYSSADVLFTTTVAAATTSSITFADVPSSTVLATIIGMQMIVGGQRRYLSNYDANTNTASFFLGSDWDQAPYNPVPANGTVVTLNAKTYVVAYKPITGGITGLSFINDHADPDAPNQDGFRGPQVSMTSDFRIEDVTVRGFPISALVVGSSFRPDLSNITVMDANYAGLGYGIQWSRCREHHVYNWRGSNCRRGTDTAGLIQCWDGVIETCQYDGGYKNFQGDIWATSQNYAWGGHGQDAGTLYRNLRATGVTVLGLDRGTKCTWQNITGDGEQRYGIIKSAGQDITILGNVTDDGWRADSPSPPTPFYEGEERSFLYLVLNERWPFSGKVTIKNLFHRGFKYTVYLQTRGRGGSWTNWEITDTSGELRTPGLSFLVDADVAVSLTESYFANNYYRTIGQDVGRWPVLTGSSITFDGSWLRTGVNSFILALADDTFTTINAPVDAGSELALIEVYANKTAEDTFYARGLITLESNGPGGTHGLTRDLSVGGAVNVHQYAPPFTGTTGLDGALNVGFSDRTKLWFENRLGGTRRYIHLLVSTVA